MPPGGSDRLDERDVRLLGEQAVAEIERAPRGDVAVGVDDRHDDDPLAPQQGSDAGCGLLLHEHLGELHCGLRGGPLAGVMEPHREEHRTTVGAVDVARDLDARDLAPLIGRAEDDLAHEPRMLGDELLELGLDVVVRAVARATRGQRRARRAGARRGAPVGSARVRKRRLEVRDAGLDTQARQAQRRELDGARDDDVGPAAAAVLGHVEAGALERFELRLAAAHAHELRRAGRQLGQRREHNPQRDAGAPARAGVAAGLDDELASGPQPALDDLAAAEAARGGDPVAGAVAQEQIPVAAAAQARVEHADHRRAVRRRGALRARRGRERPHRRSEQPGCELSGLRGRCEQQRGDDAGSERDRP